MKKLTLQPEQVIAPGEYEVGNNSILRKYFRIFNNGHLASVPPVIVIDMGSISKLQELLEETYKFWEEKRPEVVSQRRKDYQDLFSIVKKHPYVLIDGNHRAIAATLTHNPFSALKIEEDSDIFEIRERVHNNTLPLFYRPESTLEELRNGFVSYCLEIGEVLPPRGLLLGKADRLKDVINIKERVEKLVKNEDLPKYMIKRYKQTK